MIAVGDLTEMLARIRKAIADVEASREQVQAQMTALEASKVRLRGNQAKAAEIGRPDLVGEADRRIQLVEDQIGELTEMLRKLDHEIVKLSEAAGRLQVRIKGR